MWHRLLHDASFFELLYEIDKEIAAKVRAGNCRHCGGTLDSASYPRKARGGPDDLDEDCASRRLSFCCRRKGCRRRATPPSVRFLGRRVYWGVIVVLQSAMQQGVTGFRARRLQRALGVDRQTVERWREWWLAKFPGTRFWQVARARFVPPIEVTTLPLSLLERFEKKGYGDNQSQLVGLLRFLSPITTNSATVSFSDGG